MNHCIAAIVLGCALLLSAFSAPALAQDAQVSFTGVRALVVRPENSWGDWEVAVYGALCNRGIEVTWSEPAILADPKALAGFDLIATNIKRSYTPAQITALKAYLEAGGALYGSWGGPMQCPELLNVCGVGHVQSVWIKGMTLLESPLTQGLGEQRLAFPDFAGHMRSVEKGVELVAVDPADGGAGTVVARDPSGRSLGVLSRYGKGRTAVLGFGPENPKIHFPRQTVAATAFDNLLQWLLPQDRPARPWPATIRVSLPARAQVLSVTMGDTPVADPQVRAQGSLRTVTLDARRVAPGQSTTIRVRYRPLERKRNVETIIHLPWGVLAALETPQKAVEFVAGMHATVVQPLLRADGGYAWYRGMPEDIPDAKIVTGYRGDFLAEFIELCHQRGIQVIGGVYFDSRTPLAQYPEVVRLDKDGKPDKGACFNNPKAQEHNLKTIEQLLSNYKLDGLILDDNFEMSPCYCAVCKAGFKAYARQHGLPDEDPATSTNEQIRQAWRPGGEYWHEVSRAIAGKVRAIAAQHGVPAGGWVGPGSEPLYLVGAGAGGLDFLGGMVYACPASSVRMPLSQLGETPYITLLWGPNRAPADLEAEVTEAIRAGSSTVGYWVLASEEGVRQSGGFCMEQGSREAIGRALGRAPADWLAFYRENLVSGDPRMAVLDAHLGNEELVLTVKNLGQRAEPRIQAKVDLSVLE